MKIYSRRKFLKTAAAGAAGLPFVPNSILGESFGHMAPS
ncbi:twin-arginine translocation signal domain-containing protein, partial [Proteiniphilum sp. UBA5480]